MHTLYILDILIQFYSNILTKIITHPYDKTSKGERIVDINKNIILLNVLENKL